jgi:membrane fusion protein, multidrug efflux system
MAHSNPWWASRHSRQVGLVSAVLAIAGGLVWFIMFRPYVATDDARVAATLVRISSQGTSPGVIQKLNVTEGDKVKAGDVLIELDHGTAQANFNKTKAKLDLATTDLKRAEQLSAQHGLPPRELDRVKSELAVAQADFDLAQIALEHTYLKSPIDGVVVQKSTELGNLLEPGQAALTVADVDHAWISANIEETSVRKVKAGQLVTIDVDEGGSLTGRVSEVREAAAAQFALIPSDNAAGNFTKLVQRIPVKISIDPGAAGKLKVGESVEVQIRVK